MYQYESLASPRATKAVLETYGLAMKHHLGQNFLVSEDIIQKILAFAELTPEDVVLEVGPGIGTLSRALLSQGVHLCCLEADPELPPILEDTLAGASERVRIIQRDALKVSQADIAEALTTMQLTTMPNKLVSNLPYQIAATIVLKQLAESETLDTLVVMVQAEVASRMAASCGSKVYGAYTAKLGLYAEVDGRFEVAPHNFMPPPHVQSSVIRIRRRLHPAFASYDPVQRSELRAWCSMCIDKAFAQRRKTLVNSMSAQGIDAEVIRTALEELGHALTVRAEALSVDELVALALRLKELLDV